MHYSLSKIRYWFMNAKKHSFENLFRTLLHELMTAKVRVHNLKLELVS